VSGDWKITDKATSTLIELHILGDLTLPLPSLMKMIVAPMVQAEFEKAVEQYISNLTQRFGGEV
jgi:hypothetical protein